MKRILLASLLVLVLGLSVMPGVTGATSDEVNTYIVAFHEDQEIPRRPPMVCSDNTE